MTLSEQKRFTASIAAGGAVVASGARADNATAIACTQSSGAHAHDAVRDAQTAAAGKLFNSCSTPTRCALRCTIL